MDDANESTPGRNVEAVQLTCDVINALKTLQGGGVTEIADEIGKSKAAVHGHLATLHDNELVIRNGSEYQLSLGFLDLGEHAKRQLDVYPIVKEEVERLADETEEVVQFMVKENSRGVYVYRMRGENAIRTASYPGKREYLHRTALGKAILSRLPDEELERIIAIEGLPPKTENTITEEDRLFEEVSDIREQGISFDDEEIVKGLRCVAVSISLPSVHEYGAISVSGPMSRFKDEYFRETLPEKLFEAANKIEINASHTLDSE